MMRLVRAFALAAALLGLLTIVACGDEEEGGTPTTQATTAPTTAVGGGGTPTAQATATPTSVDEEGEGTPAAEATAAPTTPAGGAIEMGIDPETTGNTASTLGTLERCARVDVPSPAFDGVSDYNIDIYVKGDTQAPIAYDASVTYDNTKVHIAAPGTDVLIKMPGATSMAETGTPPDTDGTFTAGVIYFDPAESRIPGDGVLVRLGLDIGGSGLVTFALNPPPLSAYASGLGLHTVTLASAQLAINQDCPR
jgi:hypothetical protein